MLPFYHGQSLSVFGPRLKQLEPIGGLAFWGRGKSRTNIVWLESCERSACRHRHVCAKLRATDAGKRFWGKASLDWTGRDSGTHAATTSGRFADGNLSAAADPLLHHRPAYGAQLQQAVLARRERGDGGHDHVRNGQFRSQAAAAPATTGLAGAHHERRADGGASCARSAQSFQDRWEQARVFFSEAESDELQAEDQQLPAPAPVQKTVRAKNPLPRVLASAGSNAESNIGALAFAPPTGPATFTLASVTSEPVSRETTGSLRQKRRSARRHAISGSWTKSNSICGSLSARAGQEGRLGRLHLEGSGGCEALRHVACRTM